MKAFTKTILSFVVLISLIFACSTVDKVSKEKTVKYEVTGTSGLVDITMSNAGGGTEQLSNVTTPWTKTLYMKNGFMYISAQNQRDQGSVKVKIYVDGKVVKQSESEGEYCIASASDMLR